MTLPLFSRSTVTNLGLLYIVFLIVGIKAGLAANGPFEYLDAQFAFHEIQQSAIADHATGPELTNEIVTTIITEATAVAMRGVTIGYNAPPWVTIELVYAITFYVVAAATIVLTRAWKYTTTIRPR